VVTTLGAEGPRVVTGCRNFQHSGSRYPHPPSVTSAPISVLEIAVSFLEIPCHNLPCPPLEIEQRD